MRKALEFLTNWVELSFILLLILGFVISVFVNDVLLSYALVLMAGLGSGKIIYHKAKDFLFPHILLITGFILGFIIGHKEGSTIALILIFLAGNAISYYAHKKLGLD
jgi:hypothetical protein